MHFANTQCGDYSRNSNRFHNLPTFSSLGLLPGETVCMSPLVPILGIVTSLVMMLSLTGVTWLRLAVWLMIGMMIYFSYSRHHSHVQQSVGMQKSELTMQK